MLVVSFLFVAMMEATLGCVPKYGPGRYLLNMTTSTFSKIRPFLLNVPSKKNADGGLAGGGVVGFHGWHSNPWYYDALSNLTNITEDYAMTLALPFGTGQKESFYCCPENVTAQECSDGTFLDASDGACGWKNSEDQDLNPEFADVDDVAFAKALASYMVDELCVDPEKIFATGLSDGATMTARIACDAADIFKGVAMMSGDLRMRRCAPAKALAFLEFCGTQDGACNSTSYDTFDKFVAFDNCAKDDWHLTYESATTSCRLAESCLNGGLVEQCMIAGLGDAIPGHDRNGPIVPGTTYIPQAPTNLDSVNYAFDRWSTLFPSPQWPQNPVFPTSKNAPLVMSDNYSQEK